MNDTRWSIIAVALVWAAVILATAIVLKGTPYWPQLLPIVAAARRRR